VVLRLRGLFAAATSLTMLVGSADGQTTSRRLTTIDALRQFPGYYHLQSVLLRGEFMEDRNRVMLRSDEHELRVMLDANVTTTPGPVEVRGQLIDVGRLEPSDARVGSFAEGRDAERWPRPGEELFVRVSGVTAAQPAAALSVRAIALEPWKYEGQKVTVVGNFRGRNLFGELPGAPGKSRYDFVLRGAEGFIWITGLRPRGRGFDLDVDRRVDSDQWLEVSGVVVRERGLVTIAATQLAAAKAPQAVPTADEADAPVVPLPPIEVVFSSPSDGETDVSKTGPVRIQFSRGIDEKSIAGSIRVSYLGAVPQEPGSASPAAPAFQTTYDAGNRAITVRFAQPLEPFRTLRIEIVDTLRSFDGAAARPWSLTFSVGD
jgi:hypothetical protein